MFGLTEPRIGRLSLPATVFGKRSPSYIHALAPTVIIDNWWPAAADVLAFSPGQYLGVCSQQLEQDRLFIFIRRDAAERIGGPMIATLGGHMVSAEDELDTLRRRFPSGQ
jgi:hypothetical protein